MSSWLCHWPWSMDGAVLSLCRPNGRWWECWLSGMQGIKQGLCQLQRGSFSLLGPDTGQGHGRQGLGGTILGVTQRIPALQPFLCSPPLPGALSGPTVHGSCSALDAEGRRETQTGALCSWAPPLALKPDLPPHLMVLGSQHRDRLSLKWQMTL